MDERDEHHADDYQISSSSRRLDQRTRVLKHADSFLVVDRLGDVDDSRPSESGLYHQDTRFLSRLSLRLGLPDRAPRTPMLLSSSARDDNAILFVHLTNPPLAPDSSEAVPQGLLHLMRTQVLWQSWLCERLRIHHYGEQRLAFQLHLAFAADFADIFEARGTPRERRGERLPARQGARAVELAYDGLDHRRRRTRIGFDQAPHALGAGDARFDVELSPGEAFTLRWTVGCQLEPTPEPGHRGGRASGRTRNTVHAGDPLPADDLPWCEAAVDQRRAETQLQASAEPVLASSNRLFDAWIGRSLADLHMLATGKPGGRYPYAGVPWFSTPFGRDGIITALECLWCAPDLARGVLSYLAAHQADRENDAQDAQPGKILHETRAGEMAATGEVPFGLYYGSIDATPLFLMLGGAYFERTADLELVRALWPNFERALAWIEHYGDCDGDGFVEYVRRTERGLANQGWKDSHDAVFHADGRMAEAPIALCEVQGYVYAALRAKAVMADALGLHPRAEALRQRAEALRLRFEEHFWCEELGTYALALDGHKRPCRVASSNAGQVLYTGICSPARARRVADSLMGESGFSGWGVRTVASTAARYNPMSYHNGSVWPHDNALIAAGLARYGLQGHAATLFSGLFDAASHFDLHRLPELFCGFGRHPGEGPTLYPQACSPQAWAAAAPLLCLQACLGLEVRGTRNRVYLHNPVMPAFLEQLRVSGLRLPGGQMDIVVTRHEGDVGVRLMRRDGDVALDVAL